MIDFIYNFFGSRYVNFWNLLPRTLRIIKVKLKHTPRKFSKSKNAQKCLINKTLKFSTPLHSVESQIDSRDVTDQSIYLSAHPMFMIARF